MVFSVFKSTCHAVPQDRSVCDTGSDAADTFSSSLLPIYRYTLEEDDGWAERFLAAHDCIVSPS
jgi:hypothetical protein